MVRPIDATSLKRVIQIKRKWHRVDNDEVLELINDAPTIDMIEVVRCAECKLHDNSFCYRFGSFVDDKGYCDRGKRKTH